MDTIPDDIYEHIFSYLLGDTVKVNDLFFHNFFRGKWIRLQLVNKKFKSNFKSYVKRNPIWLQLESNKKDLDSLKCLKKYYNVENGIRVHRLSFGCDGNNNNITQNIKEELKGFNFNSLRELYLNGKDFDLEILRECQGLTFISLGNDYVKDLDEVNAEKLKSFLSFHKHTMETLMIPLILDSESYHDLIPKDLSWPTLKKLFIGPIQNSSSITKEIKSNTLESLKIYYDNTCNIVIKCPNLKVILIDNIGSYHQIKSKDRSPCKPYGEDDEKFTSTCPPSELSKIGIKVVEVSSNCDIGICCWEDYL